MDSVLTVRKDFGETTAARSVLMDASLVTLRTDYVNKLAKARNPQTRLVSVN